MRRAAALGAFLAATLCGAGAACAANAQSKSQQPAKAAAAAASSDASIAPLLQQVKAAFDKNDFAAAVDPLQRILAARPDDPIAHFQLGYAYSELKRWDDAKSEYSRAVALDPKMAAAHLNLGLVLMDSDPAAAAESFRHAADLQPKESRPRYLTGQALERAGKLPEASEQYKAALALSPNDYEYHFALARVLLRAGDPAGAEVQFRAAVAVRADAAPAQLGLASSLLAQKKYAGGAAALAEYLKLKPDDRGERLNRVSALMEIDQFDEALAELDRAETGTPPTVDSLKMRGGILMQQKKWQDAAATLTRALQLSQTDPELFAWLGRVELELRDFPAAAKWLNQSLAMNPTGAGPLRDLVDAYYLGGEYPSTLAALDRLAQLETPKPISWFVRATCYDKLMHKPEAIEAYQKFLDLDQGKSDTQDFQARQRIRILEDELGRSPKKH